MVFFASLISLTLVDSGLLWAQIQFQSLGAFYLTLIFACNVSLISILSFMEIVMQRINVSILSRSVLFTTSMVSLILFWLGSMVFDITIKNLMMAHSLLLCVLLAISSFIIVANYRLHNWTDFNQKL